MSDQIIDLLDSLGNAVEILLAGHLRNLYEIRRAERQHGMDTCTEEIDEVNELFEKICNQRKNLKERRERNGTGIS